MPTNTPEYQRKYYKLNAQKYATKYQKTKFCEPCNCMVKSPNWNRHLLTDKHKNSLDGNPSKIHDKEVASKINKLRLEVKDLITQITELEAQFM